MSSPRQPLALRHIEYISDQKQQKGRTYYRLKYRDADREEWVTRASILRDCHNKDCLDRYEMMLNVCVDDQAKLAGKNSPGKEKVHLRAKSLNVKKKVINKKPKPGKTRNVSQDEDAAEPQENSGYLRLLNSLKVALSNTNNSEQAKDMISTKDKKINKKEVQSVVNGKEANLKATQSIIETEQPSQKEFPGIVSTRTADKKQSQEQTKKEQKTLQTLKYQITKAKLNLQGEVEFQITYENGLSAWMEGSKVKKNSPMEVIEFYEKRISWGC